MSGVKKPCTREGLFKLLGHKDEKRAERTAHLAIGAFKKGIVIAEAFWEQPKRYLIVILFAGHATGFPSLIQDKDLCESDWCMDGSQSHVLHLITIGDMWSVRDSEIFDAMLAADTIGRW
jgi:hypothetical protein